MDETVIVIMEKNSKTGFLEKEIGSYTVKENDNLLVNAFCRQSDKTYLVHMKLTCPYDVADWEFDAIYDYYDTDDVKEKTNALAMEEVTPCYNPTWEIIFNLLDGQEEMEEKINSIVEIHKKELDSVFEAIKDKENEYTSDE